MLSISRIAALAFVVQASCWSPAAAQGGGCRFLLDNCGAGPGEPPATPPAPPPPPGGQQGRAPAEPGSGASSIWSHNGSTVYLEAAGQSRRFYYDVPRSGMAAAGARHGTLLFDGRISGGDYVGTAYVFSRSCGGTPYHVEGPVAADFRSVTLQGEAPRVRADCQVTGHIADVLVFEFLHR